MKRLGMGKDILYLVLKQQRELVAGNMRMRINFAKAYCELLRFPYKIGIRTIKKVFIQYDIEWSRHWTLKRVLECLKQEPASWVAGRKFSIEAITAMILKFDGLLKLPSNCSRSAYREIVSSVVESVHTIRRSGRSIAPHLDGETQKKCVVRVVQPGQSTPPELSLAQQKTWFKDYIQDHVLFQDDASDRKLPCPLGILLLESCGPFSEDATHHHCSSHVSCEHVEFGPGTFLGTDTDLSRLPGVVRVRMCRHFLLYNGLWFIAHESKTMAAARAKNQGKKAPAGMHEYTDPRHTKKTYYYTFVDAAACLEVFNQLAGEVPDLIRPDACGLILSFYKSHARYNLPFFVARERGAAQEVRLFFGPNDDCEHSCENGREHSENMGLVVEHTPDEDCEQQKQPEEPATDGDDDTQTEDEEKEMEVVALAEDIFSDDGEIQMEEEEEEEEIIENFISESNVDRASASNFLLKRVSSGDHLHVHEGQAASSHSFAFPRNEDVLPISLGLEDNIVFTTPFPSPADLLSSRACPPWHHEELGIQTFQDLYAEHDQFSIASF